MRLATFIPEGESRPLCGAVRNGAVLPFADGVTVLDVLAGDAEPHTDGRTFALDAGTLLAPYEPRAIFGVGLNYRLHAQLDGGIDVPDDPMIFLKGPAAAAAPGGPVRRPPTVRELDYEAELALIIGRDGRIAGYAIANDISARDIRDRQLARHKGGDTFCPFGPWVTTADEIADPYTLGIRCWVNGDLRQDASTSEMVLRADQIIEAIQLTIELAPGDLILTGTPAGVGFATKRWLQPGDVVRIEIDGLGSIEHSIVQG